MPYSKGRRQARVFIRPNRVDILTERPLPGDLRHRRLRRLARVEPASFTRRQMFRVCRVFGDFTRLAQWTRTWRGPWRVDLSRLGGGVLGPFPTREEAVRQEAELVAKHLREEAAHVGFDP